MPNCEGWSKPLSARLRLDLFDQPHTRSGKPATVADDRSCKLPTRAEARWPRPVFLCSRDAHDHFNLDLDFRPVECLDANRRDAGHLVADQFT